MDSGNEQERLVVDSTGLPKVTTLGRVLEMQALKPADTLPSIRVIEEDQKTLIVISPKKIEEKIYRWDVGMEDEEGWNEYLLTYKRKWACAATTVAAPCLLYFCIPFFVKIIKGVWMVPSRGWTADTLVHYNEHTTPAVLVNHFFLACIMLVMLICQVALALAVVKRSSVPGDTQHCLHRWCGRFAAGMILICSATGTLSLAFCDVGPKRGVESAFFVWIGILIMVSCYKAVMFAARKKYGLHMQYMYMTLFLVTSPGWNRIVIQLQKLLLVGPKGFYDQHTIDCLNIPTASGFYWTWSFVVGQLWYYGVWKCAGIPYVKRYSTGFWMNLSAFLLCAVCVWEMVENSADYGIRAAECTQEALDEADLITTAINNHGHFSVAFAYGLCTPIDVDYGMKIPAFYANPNTTYIKGYPGYY